LVPHTIAADGDISASVIHTETAVAGETHLTRFGSEGHNRILADLQQSAFDDDIGCAEVAGNLGNPQDGAGRDQGGAGEFVFRIAEQYRASALQGKPAIGQFAGKHRIGHVRRGTVADREPAVLVSEIQIIGEFDRAVGAGCAEEENSV
jgi:hypothetical protein